jgi:hypothetical protein
VWFWLFRDSDYGRQGEHTHWGLTPVTFIFAASTVALVLVSLITRPPSAATVAKFFGPRLPTLNARAVPSEAVADGGSRRAH